MKEACNSVTICQINIPSIKICLFNSFSDIKIVLMHKWVNRTDIKRDNKIIRRKETYLVITLLKEDDK
jgi:hypothetical protein